MTLHGPHSLGMLIIKSPINIPFIEKPAEPGGDYFNAQEGYIIYRIGMEYFYRNDAGNMFKLAINTKFVELNDNIFRDISNQLTNSKT